MANENGLVIEAVAVIAGVALEIAALLRPTAAFGGEEGERRVFVEFGVVAEREITERNSHLGPAIGIEGEPIENWLEVELSASTYRSRGATTWGLEMPFKMPFRWSDTVEVMPGLGPTWSYTQTGARRGVWGAEAVVDFFYRPGSRMGWYVEPSYGYAFGGGAKSVAITGGVFFAVP